MKSLKTKIDNLTKGYTKAINGVPVRQVSMASAFLLIGLFIVHIIIDIMAFTYTGEEVIYMDGFFMFTIAPMFGAHFVFHNIKTKPSMAALTPISYKRRVAIQVIYPYVAALLAVLCYLLVLFAISIIVMLFDPTSVDYSDSYTYAGAGMIALFFRGCFAYGCNLILACQKKIKCKVISYAVYLIVYFAATALTGLAINGFNFDVGFSAMYSAQFNNMAVPWLGYILWAAAGIGAIVAAVFYLLKLEKPREY